MVNLIILDSKTVASDSCSTRAVLPKYWMLLTRFINISPSLNLYCSISDFDRTTLLYDWGFNPISVTERIYADNGCASLTICRLRLINPVFGTSRDT